MSKSSVVKADFSGKTGRPNPRQGLEAIKGAEGIQHLLRGGAKKELTKKEQKKIKKFGKEFKKLAEQTGADASDFRADQTQRAVYRSLMAMVMGIIPIAQEKYMESKSENAFYALRSAAEQLQALMSGIRTLESLEEQADHINVKIVGPSLVNMLSSQLVTHQTVKARIDSMDISNAQRAVIKKLLDEVIMENASYVKEMQQSINASVNAYLVGDA